MSGLLLIGTDDGLIYEYKVAVQEIEPELESDQKGKRNEIVCDLQPDPVRIGGES
jgi:hypothetical protein